MASKDKVKFYIISITIGIALLLLVTYLIYLLRINPKLIFSIAEPLIVFDGIIFGFQSILLQSQYEAFGGFVEGIKTGQYKGEETKGLFTRTAKGLSIKFASLIFLLFSSIFCFLVIAGSSNMIYIAIALTYIGSYLLMTSLLNLIMAKISIGYKHLKT